MQPASSLPVDALRKIFGYLNGVDLLRARCVCRYWRFVGNDRTLWRRLALQATSALTPDPHAWPLLLASAPQSWRYGYMKLHERASQTIRVEVYSYGISVFDIIAHRVQGPAVSLSRQLVVYRRLRAILLQSTHNATVFYLAPNRFDSDFLSYSTFAHALARKDQVGLALGGRPCAVIPPGFLARKYFNYGGDGLLLVVQEPFSSVNRKLVRARNI